MSEQVEQRLTDLATQVAEQLGYELYHLGYRKSGSRSLLRVYIDSDNGIGLADCEAVSRRFGAALELEDIIPSSYVLEVSSPGLDRPLFQEKDYSRSTGRKVRLTTLDPIAGDRHPAGVILGCSDGIVHLGLQGGSEIAVPLSRIASARLELDLEFPRARGRG